MFDDERLYALIGERIRRVRETQTPRMSQEDLAEILGLKRTSITNIERGNQKVTLDSIYRLCARFGLDINEILPPVSDVTARVDERAIIVGGQAHEVGIKTAEAVARLRPTFRARR
jgi:transcriptional regulator with XRE-family HTH domain